jgi:hypothetical protein
MIIRRETLVRVDRKSSSEGQNEAIDPKPDMVNYRFVLYFLFAGRSQF